MSHAATPSEWRSRVLVVGLVVVATLLPIAFVVWAWIDRDGMNRLVALLWYGGIGSFLVVRPSVRSLLRWDERHRAADAT